MARIFKAKLETPAFATIEGRKFDTTKDEVVSIDHDDGIEAGAVYRTANGVEYLRLVNPGRDVIALFKKSEWEDIVESMVPWLCCDRSFLTFIDWPHLREVSQISSVYVNDDLHDVAAWLSQDRAGAKG